MSFYKTTEKACCILAAYGLWSLISNSGFGSISLGAIHTASGSCMKQTFFFMSSKMFNSSRVSLYIFECPFNVAGRCQEEQQGERHRTGQLIPLLGI